METDALEPLVVPGTLESLDEIARYVLRAADWAGLEPRVAYRLRLAVDEIATNIVVHGYEEAGLSGPVCVRAARDNEMLTVELEDSAIPFDPMSAAAPDDLTAPLEERPIGGLGVFLTLRGVDEFRYEHVGGQNRNIFMVLRKTPTEAPKGPAVLVLGGALGPIVAAAKQAGYAVRIVHSVTAALIEANSFDAKALLVDGNAPVSEVRELLTRLATLPLEKRPAVLACTTEESRIGGLVELLGAGIRDYLAPPFDPALLKARLEAALENKSLSERQEEARKQVALQLIERDVQIGRDIQLSFLPSTLPVKEGWEIAAFFRPAREVAGDFYDAFDLINGRRLGIIIADVCDKGVGAALFMALFRTLLRSGAQQNVAMSWMDPTGSITDNQDWLRGDPGKRRQSLPTIGTGPLMNAVAGTNRYMTENHGMTGYFATMFFGILDPSNGNLIYINGGHNPPMLVRADGTRELLRPSGPAVGMIAEAEYSIKQAQLFPGDTLYCYTDGATDAKDPQGRFYTEQRLFSLLDGPALGAQATVDHTRDALLAHMGNAAQFDDITMVCLHRSPLSV